MVKICTSCGEKIVNKDIIALNKKLLKTNTKKFYCINCLSNYYNCTEEDLIEKIKQYKEDGCYLFE